MQLNDINYNVYLPGAEETVSGRTEPTAADPINEGGTAAADPTRTKNEKSTAKSLLTFQNAISIGKQATAQVIGNIGVATGDYNTQGKIQEFIGLSSMAVGLAMSNPATLALSLAGIAISSGSAVYKNVQDMKKQNFTANQNARRYGGFYTGGNR